MSNKEKWVEVIEGKFVHHHQVNEFTVVTRDATEGEILAYTALIQAEKDIASVKEHIDALAADNERLQAQVAEAGKPYEAKIAELMAQISDLTDSNAKLAASNEQLSDENDELKDALSTACGDITALSASLQDNGLPLPSPSPAPISAPEPTSTPSA